MTSPYSPLYFIADIIHNIYFIIRKHKNNFNSVTIAHNYYKSINVTF